MNITDFITLAVTIGTILTSHFALYVKITVIETEFRYIKDELKQLKKEIE